MVFGSGPPNDPEARMFIVNVVLVALMLSVPNWDHPNEWIVEALESEAEETVHFQDGRKITLTVDEDAESSLAILTVERQ